MNLFHRLFHYQRYSEVRASFNKSRLALVDVVSRSPFHKAAMRRIYSDLAEQSVARRVLLFHWIADADAGGCVAQ